VIVENATAMLLHVRVGLSNVGDRAAGQMTLNVLVPSIYTDLTWTGAGGQRPRAASPPAPTAETLPDDANELPDDEPEAAIQRVFRDPPLPSSVMCSRRR
jgi:hypothetical protein